MPDIVVASRLDAKSTLLKFMVLAAAYAGLSLGLQLLFPAIAGTALSPLEISLWVAIIAGLACTAMRISTIGRQGDLFRYWLLALAAIAAIAALQAEDWTVENLFGNYVGRARTLEYAGNAALAITVAAWLIAVAGPLRGHHWLRRALLATIAFQVLVLAGEVIQSGRLFATAAETHAFTFTTEMAELLCIEFYVVAVALTGIAGSQYARPASLGDRLAKLAPTAVGTRMRLVYRHAGLTKARHHPPIDISYYPVFQEITVGLVAGWLAIMAGPGVRAATGVPVFRQFVDMLRLWFAEGIDPPSYYAQEFYRRQRQAAAGEYLTRFETKNGLLSALNKLNPRPFGVNELGHKELFGQCCTKFGIPHPRLLMTIEHGKAEILGTADDLKTDLFCKRQKGMGAIGTLAFGYRGDGCYTNEDGHALDLAGLIAEVDKSSQGGRMLVQPWLRNHPDIADLAGESVITFRVVTVLDQYGRPEVTLAMLRVLAKLEPAWPDARDEEYAAPIDLATGRMGRFTGDNMTTSALRYDNQPLTGAPVKGRVIKEWPAIRDLALQAHRAFNHMVHVGWDIALTPDGPLVLEGNTNLDVMFLQRVHDVPLGRTRFGDLLSHHLDTYVRQRRLVYPL